ncbi:MAG: DUF3365 domain-containing protein [Chitinophagaceae bacterium]|nr:DUF3365 domain-containing protein [Chitinophagaceae bacterium]
MFKLILLLTFSTAMIVSCTGKKGAENEALWKSKGDSLISLTFDTLRNTLLRAIGKNGLPGAVAFCNTEATGLTNTYATERVIIRRSSDKVRNPANAPDSLEQRILSSFYQMIKQKKELTPVLEKDAEGNLHYFKPIIFQAMCLDCHGDRSTQIKPDVWRTIQYKYPADSAFNYKEGDLRGVWHVLFKKEK